MTAQDQSTSLTRSNLLRLESTELLAESYLHIHPPSLSPHSNEGYLAGEERAHWEVKWSPVVRKYLHAVNDVLMDGKKVTSLSPDVCQVDNGYRVPLGSDKFVKHVNCAGDKDVANKWEFDSPSSLTLVPVGSLAYLGNAGLTNRHANGGNLPVLDVAVLVGEGFLSGKDYMNGRYVDVSTTCCK